MHVHMLVTVSTKYCMCSVQHVGNLNMSQQCIYRTGCVSYCCILCPLSVLILFASHEGIVAFPVTSIFQHAMTDWYAGAGACYKRLPPDAL